MDLARNASAAAAGSLMLFERVQMEIAQSLEATESPVITPRVTRLLRTPGLRAFQRAIALAAGGDDLDRLRDTLVIVSTSGAVDQLRRSLEELWLVEQWQPSADELAVVGVATPSPRQVSSGGPAASRLMRACGRRS